MKTILTLFAAILLILSFRPEACGQSPDEIIFRTEGSSFSPLIQVNSPATVLWTFADGTTSNALNPVKEYGTTASRINRLMIDPWNTVKLINIGYGVRD